MTHPGDEELVLSRHEPDAAITSHLADCEPCQRRDAWILEVLEALSAAAVPERGERYERDLWRRLEPSLPGRSPRSWTLPLPRLVWTGGMAALVVLAFLAGQRWSGPAAPSGPVRERVLLLAIGEHLERSQMVLLELRSLTGDGDDFAREQGRADSLVRASRLYRQSAARAGEADLARLLEELERVLLDVARTPGSPDPEERAALAARIESRGVLFRVRVLSAHVKERERALSRRPSPTDTLRSTR